MPNIKRNRHLYAELYSPQQGIGNMQSRKILFLRHFCTHLLSKGGGTESLANIRGSQVVADPIRKVFDYLIATIERQNNTVMALPFTHRAVTWLKKQGFPSRKTLAQALLSLCVSRHQPSMVQTNRLRTFVKGIGREGQEQRPTCAGASPRHP